MSSRAHPPRLKCHLFVHRPGFVACSSQPICVPQSIRYASAKASPVARQTPVPQSSSRPPQTTSSPPSKLTPRSKLPIPSATSQALASQTQLSSRINPPSSTLPPLLEIPTRQSNQSSFSHLFAVGKAYLKFYKAGVRQTWWNMKASRELRRRTVPVTTGNSLLDFLLRSSRLRHYATQPPQSPLPTSTTSSSTAAPPTRAEFQLLRRARADTRRLPLFALILLVFGEWTPALVLLFRGVVPRPCQIPRQTAHALRKRHARREKRLEGFEGARMRGKRNAADAGADGLNGKRVSGLVGAAREKMERGKREWEALAYALAYRMGTYSTVLDVFNLTERVLVHRLRYLDVDDVMLKRDAGGSSAGAVAELSKEEVRIACDERGIEVLRRTGEKDKKGRPVWAEIKEEELRRQLKDWLNKGGWRSLKLLEGPKWKLEL